MTFIVIHKMLSRSDVTKAKRPARTTKGPFMVNLSSRWAKAKRKRSLKRKREHALRLINFEKRYVLK